MIPLSDYTKVRQLLCAMLTPKGEPPARVDDRTRNMSERNFMIATSAHIVAMYHTAQMAGFNAAEAMKGWDALNADVRKKMFEICDEEPTDASEEANRK